MIPVIISLEGEKYEFSLYSNDNLDFRWMPHTILALAKRLQIADPESATPGLKLVFAGVGMSIFDILMQAPLGSYLPFDSLIVLTEDDTGKRFRILTGLKKLCTSQNLEKN